MILRAGQQIHFLFWESFHVTKNLPAAFGGGGGGGTTLKVFHLANRVWVYLCTSTNTQSSQHPSAWGTYPALCYLPAASRRPFQGRSLPGFSLQLWELFHGTQFSFIRMARFEDSYIGREQLSEEEL